MSKEKQLIILVLTISLYSVLTTITAYKSIDRNNIFQEQLQEKSDSIEVSRQLILNLDLCNIRLSEICDKFQSSKNFKDNDSLYLELIDNVN